MANAVCFCSGLLRGGDDRSGALLLEHVQDVVEHLLQLALVDTFEELHAEQGREQALHLVLVDDAVRRHGGERDADECFLSAELGGLAAAEYLIE